MPGFNPFSFMPSSKNQPAYPQPRPVLRPGQNTFGAAITGSERASLPPEAFMGATGQNTFGAAITGSERASLPPEAFMGATGPEMPQPDRPPPPPNPSLIPPMPQQGPTQMGPPRAAPVPNEGDGGLSMPPGGGMKDPFSQMNDEQMKSIIGLGNMPQEMSQLDSQIAQSEALRGRGMPEGRDSGRVYTAASPLEFGGELMKQYAARRELKGGPERLGGLIKAQSGLYNDRKAMLDKATGTRKSFFDLVRGQSGGL